MSVEVLPYAGRKQDSKPDELLPITTVKYATREYGTEIGSFEIRPAQRSAVLPTKRESKEKVLRRLDGFLIEDEGEEYKVAFVENENLVFYYLPASPLRKAGIGAPNQPFQMDEIEVQLPSGRNVTGYSFVALAKPSDSFKDSIELNEERRRKLAAVFKRFGKVKD
jgi:hypothetical protein